MGGIGRQPWNIPEATGPAPVAPPAPEVGVATALGAFVSWWRAPPANGRSSGLAYAAVRFRLKALKQPELGYMSQAQVAVGRHRHRVPGYAARSTAASADGDAARGDGPQSSRIAAFHCEGQADGGRGAGGR